MAASDELVYRQAVAEISSAQRPSTYTWGCYIEANGRQLKPYRLAAMDVTCDFQYGCSDEIVIEVLMTQGDYIRHVYPFREDLVVRLTRTFVGEQGTQEIRDLPMKSFRYRAIPLDAKDMDLQGQPSIDNDQTLVTYKFQLMDFTIEQLRLEMVGGIFYQERTIDVLRTLLGVLSMRLDVPTDVRCKGVEFVEPNEETVFENVIIKHGTNVLDLGGYLQKRSGGIYNHGIGTYYQRRNWYVYPLYDIERYEVSGQKRHSKEDYALDVFLVPPNRMPSTERTFQVKDDRLQILCTGDIRQTDREDIDNLTKGNGTRFMLAGESFNAFAGVKDNRATANPERTSAQFMLKPREHEYQYAPFSDNLFTDNVAYEMSKIAARKGEIISVVWENSRPDLIPPGMPLKLMYSNESDILTLYGTVLGMQYTTAPADPGISSSRYRTNAVLILFVVHVE